MAFAEIGRDLSAIGISKVRIFFYSVSFLRQNVFFRVFSHDVHVKQLTFHHVL